MSLIELKNVYFSYEDGTEIFNDFSLSIEEASCVIISGDNGSGKTTLFRILNGLSFLDDGKYTFDNIEITKDYLKTNKNAKIFHKRIGYLFQNPDIMLFNARVYDEIAFGPRQMGLSEEEISKRTNDCLDLFGLSDFADKAPYHLSGGQKKKVAFASIMSLNPEVLILDEPFASIDKSTQKWMIKFLKELKEAGKTIVIATHNNDIITELADDVIEL